MRCAMLIETLMKVYERIRTSSGRGVDSGKPGEVEIPPTSDSDTWRQPGPSSRPPEPTSTPLSTPITSCGTTMTGGNLTEGTASEPVLNCNLGFDGLTNLDQMGGIELFFSQPMWPENMLLGQEGPSDSGGAGEFDLRDLFGLYDAQL